MFWSSSTYRYAPLINEDESDTRERVPANYTLLNWGSPAPQYAPIADEEEATDEPTQAMDTTTAPQHLVSFLTLVKVLFILLLLAVCFAVGYVATPNGRSQRAPHAPDVVPTSD
jgi:hypothetical protein